MAFFHGMRFREGDSEAGNIRIQRVGVIGLVGTSDLGEDEKVYVINSRDEAEATFGIPSEDNNYTIPKALSVFYDQGNPVVVVIKVDPAVVPDAIVPASEARILGDWNGDGVVDKKDLSIQMTEFNKAKSKNNADKEKTAEAAESQKAETSELPGAESPPGTELPREEQPPDDDAPKRAQTPQAGEREISQVVTGERNLDGSLTGANLLLSAQNEVGVKPDIIYVADFSEDEETLRNLMIIAGKLGAILYADIPNSFSPDQAGAYTARFSADPNADRTKLCYPKQNIGSRGIIGAGAIAAGVRSKIDDEIGYWASESNKGISGFVRPTKAISFSITDSSSDANLLNSNNVTTIVDNGGPRVWGNRGIAPQTSDYTFTNVRRTMDKITEAILTINTFAVDAVQDAAYYEFVTNTVEGLLRVEQTRGAINGGEFFINKKTTREAIRQGQNFYTLKITPVYPAEDITVEISITDQFLTIGEAS